MPFSFSEKKATPSLASVDEVFLARIRKSQRSLLAAAALFTVVGIFSPTVVDRITNADRSFHEKMHPYAVHAMKQDAPADKKVRFLTLALMMSQLDAMQKIRFYQAHVLALPLFCLALACIGAFFTRRRFLKIIDGKTAQPQHGTQSQTMYRD